MSPTITAAQRYKDTQTRVKLHITALQAAMDAHAEKAATDPRNHGFAGDLSEVERHLIEAMRMLSWVTE